jgi:predicted nucleic acid-binding protein
MRSVEAVYIETTIPSFYFEVRTDPSSVHHREITRRFWDGQQKLFMFVTSAFTLHELREAPEFMRSGAIALMAKVPVLSVPERFEEAVGTYLAHQVMPRDATGDAAHLAMASLYGCEYLLTWNCRHLANARKIRHIEAINRLLGLPSPLIVTPEALLQEVP